MLVLATREGLAGQKTASGWRIDTRLSFVALPSRKALYRFVKVTNPRNGVSTLAIVMDVGPWNIADDAYVMEGARPQAETGRDSFGRVTNKAGIDLGEKVWSILGMTDNDEVEWEWI